MTQRETVLAKVVAVGVAAYVGYLGVNQLIVDPYQSLQAELDKQTARRNELNDELLVAYGVKKTWKDHTRRTLSKNEDELARRFLMILGSLLDEHGLTENRTITKRSHRRLKKSGFVEVPVHIRVTASLDEVVGFLHAFYQQPYYTQIETISLRPEKSGSSGSGSASKARRNRRKRNRRNQPREETKLSVTMVAKTLWLPKDAQVGHKKYDPDFAVDRLAEHDLSSYNAIAATNIFAKWEKPAPQPTARKPKPNSDEPKDPVVVETPTVDPREGLDKVYLVGTEVRNGEYVASVFDERSPDQPTVEYRVQDRFEPDGTVVLIHRLGIVIRADESDGNDETTTVDYFYPLGASFKQRERLDAARHPDIARDPRLTRKD